MKQTISQMRQRIACDLALQMLKNRDLLDDARLHGRSQAYTEYARGGMAATRQLVKWQVWSDFAMRDLIVKEYRRCRVIYPADHRLTRAGKPD